VKVVFNDPQTTGDPRKLTIADYEEIRRATFARG
jgi:hypothetical protein